MRVRNKGSLRLILYLHWKQFVKTELIPLGVSSQNSIKLYVFLNIYDICKPVLIKQYSIIKKRYTFLLVLFYFLIWKCLNSCKSLNLIFQRSWNIQSLYLKIKYNLFIIYLNIIRLNQRLLEFSYICNIFILQW